MHGCFCIIGFHGWIKVKIFNRRAARIAEKTISPCSLRLSGSRAACSVNKFLGFGEVSGWGRILLRKKELKREF
jgi:hypothetical protein